MASGVLNRTRQPGQSVVAVRSATFSIEPGASVGLVGESGSGKTTLALTLMGLLPANGFVTNGEIGYGQQQVAQLPEAVWQKLRWTKVALVFQGGMNALNPVHRVIDQIVEPMLVHESRAIEQHRGGAVGSARAVIA